MGSYPECTCHHLPAWKCKVDVHRNPPPVLDQFVDVVFDGPPGPESGRFVEVEDHTGASVKFGEWVEREDGYWALRIQRVEMALIAELHRVRVQMEGYKKRCELYEDSRESSSAIARVVALADDYEQDHNFGQIITHRVAARDIRKALEGGA